jgi:hypothetical protein
LAHDHYLWVFGYLGYDPQKWALPVAGSQIWAAFGAPWIKDTHKKRAMGVKFKPVVQLREIDFVAPCLAASRQLVH